MRFQSEPASSACCPGVVHNPSFHLSDPSNPPTDLHNFFRNLRVKTTISLISPPESTRSKNQQRRKFLFHLFTPVHINSMRIQLGIFPPDSDFS
ncbi:hypothetical protein CEXT_59341 [Caerostris extrusa]|uniref:Uncharacterized protein n=1 Tax=Caerostris extrusa TaxID=172846 RepID=A0AAV4PIU3_CAEEX|nr:hypothetical protein CEXT_59341 [Caerostris extrusa]